MTPAYPLYMGSEDTPLWAKFGKMFENFCRQTRSCYTFLESKFTVLLENDNVLERKTHPNPIFHDKHSRGVFLIFLSVMTVEMGNFIFIRSISKIIAVLIF